MYSETLRVETGLARLENGNAAFYPFGPARHGYELADPEKIQRAFAISAPGRTNSQPRHPSLATALLFPLDWFAVGIRWIAIRPIVRGAARIHPLLTPTDYRLLVARDAGPVSIQTPMICTAIAGALFLLFTIIALVDANHRIRFASIALTFSALTYRFGMRWVEAIGSGASIDQDRRFTD